MTECIWKNKAHVSVAALSAAISLAVTGCASMNDSEPQGEQGVGVTISLAKDISSRILDIADVQGKASEPGPGKTPCGDRGDLYKVHHPWSVLGKSNTELSSAMERLKSGLPEEGWEVIKYGPNNSKARTLELVAENSDNKFEIVIEFWEETKESDEPPKLIVSVGSACYEDSNGGGSS